MNNHIFVYFISLSICAQSLPAMEQKKFDELSSGEPYQQRMKMVEEKTKSFQQNGPPAGFQPKLKVDWLKMAEEAEKKDAKANAHSNTSPDKKTTENQYNLRDGDEEEAQPSKLNEDQETTATSTTNTGHSNRKKKSKKQLEESRWRTVGPLDKSIRRVEEEDDGEVANSEEESNQPALPVKAKLSPEEEQYQKEKEEFLKKFKKSSE